MAFNSRKKLHMSFFYVFMLLSGFFFTFNGFLRSLFKMKINGLNSTNNDDPYKQVNNKEEEVLSIAIK